jgi:hypothetical protein
VTKMREEKWHDLPRQSRLARLMWPSLMEKQFHGEVAAMSRNEGKTPPVEPEPVTRNREGKPIYNIPGFHRVPIGTK